MFKMYEEWAVAATHKKGGAAEAEATIKDLAALLEQLSDGTNKPLSGGVKQELQKTVELLGKAKK